MSYVTKTTEEFSTRRKIRYGAGSPTDSSSKDSRVGYSLTPSTVNATLSPHKTFYGKDNENNEAYFIEFNIGDFRFDEISIRTEGRRLIVQGKSQSNGQADEVSREFTRDFLLPNEVDQFSIKAQLDEATRTLTLIGRIKPKEPLAKQQTTLSTSSTLEKDYELKSISSLGVSPLSLNDTNNNNSNSIPSSNIRLGTTKENPTKTYVDYEIYLGNELRDGQIKLEISNFIMNVIVTKRSWDKYGDYSLDFKRQIKLPTNVNVPLIEHGVDFRSSNLLIKVPFNK